MAKEAWQERRAREEIERAAVTATIEDLIKLLGASVTDHESDTWQLTTLECKLHLYHETWKSRIRISGVFGHDLQKHRRQGGGSNADPTCSISVSASRPAVAIMGEIKR